MEKQIIVAAVFYLDWERIGRDKTFAATYGGEEAPPEWFNCVGVHALPPGIIEGKQVAEQLFERYNIGDHGGREDIRSLSVGDVVVLVFEGGSWATWRCASMGWEPLKTSGWDGQVAMSVGGTGKAGGVT